MALAAPLTGALLLTACGPADEDWPVYLGDSGRRHYSPLTEIDRDNVSQLEVAWVYDAGEPRGPGATMYTSPLVIDGVLYALSPHLDAFALDAATGDEIWRSELELPGNAQRGLMWWENGDDQRLFYTHGKDLIALDAADGSLVEKIGERRLIKITTDVDRAGVIFDPVPGGVFE
ncbi:MAG: pyrroloquinoline quinone-dependent dehydrogenase, partial [Holophagales bacterium]|nr:pyrroloquinoline quinone-dependent dehydrogenase [Holophagales bacterium]